MRKIINYYIVTSSLISSIIEQVNDNIKDGWEPFGNMNVCTDDEGDNFYFQTMVKYENI